MAIANRTSTVQSGPTSIDVKAGLGLVDDNRKGGLNGSLPVYAVASATGGNVMASIYNGRYMPNSLIPIIISYPKMFNKFESPTYWKEFLKWLFEVHATKITGFDASLTVEYSEYDAGDNINKYKQASKVTQATSNVVTEVDELIHNPIEKFLDAYIRYGIGDPTARGVPLITRLLTDEESATYNEAEYNTFSGIFFEPDILLRKVVRAYYVFDMQPDSNPNLTGEKDQSKSKEFVTKTITWGGVSIYSTNRNVMAVAQHYLTELKLWEQDPDAIMLPNTEVDADMANSSDNIYYEGVSTSSDS